MYRRRCMGLPESRDNKTSCDPIKFCRSAGSAPNDLAERRLKEGFLRTIFHIERNKIWHSNVNRIFGTVPKSTLLEYTFKRHTLIGIV